MFAQLLLDEIFTFQMGGSFPTPAGEQVRTEVSQLDNVETMCSNLSESSGFINNFSHR